MATVTKTRTEILISGFGGQGVVRMDSSSACVPLSRGTGSPCSRATAPRPAVAMCGRKWSSPPGRR